MWCVAAIGLAVGFGMYWYSFATTVLVLVVLWLLDRIEDWLPRSRHRTLTIRCPYQPGCIEHVIEFVQSIGVQITDYNYRRSKDPRLRWWK